MKTAALIPWSLTAILAVVCWQQQQRIQALEEDRPTAQLGSVPAAVNASLQPDVTGKTEKKDRESLVTEVTQQPQQPSAKPQKNAAQAPSKQEIEDMVEHRALERLEELEEEKRQKRVDQMTDHMQQQVDGWAEEFEWSTDTQGAMMDILTDYVHGRVEVHVMLKNETIDRDGIRPYFQQLAKERNDAIVELVGAEEFSEIEDSLHSRGGKKQGPR